MAGPAFSYDIGYYGVVKLNDNPVLATGGNVSVQYTPLYTSGVWGAGWYNTSEKIAYAPNYVTLSSSVNYQLTNGITSDLSQWAFTKRNQSKNYQILPNGKAGYSGTAYCVGCSFSASQDAIVSGDISLKTGDVNGKILTGSMSDDSEKAKTGHSVLDSIAEGYMDVYPFWATAVYFKTADSDTDRQQPTQISEGLQVDTLDWNASYSSDLVFVMTCCGQKDDLSSSTGVLQAKYCCLGSMQASGSFTVFKINDNLKPDQLRKCRNAYIKMTKSDGDGACGIKFGSIILDSGSTDLQTGTSFIQSSFNFTALGNGTKPPMQFNTASAS